MIRRRRPEEDDVIAILRAKAAEIKEEANKVSLSHTRMLEIAEDMEALAARLPDQEQE